MANTIDIVVPDLGEFENVEVIEVLVTAGGSVVREDGLITLETDKASFDVPSPESGVIESASCSLCFAFTLLRVRFYSCSFSFAFALLRFSFASFSVLFVFALLRVDFASCLLC